MYQETATGGSARHFPSTRWSLIRSAQQQPSTRRQALEELLATYWKPLYFYARRKGATIEEAKDRVQGFYVHLLEQDFIDKPDPEKGRFRAYLRVAMDHYLAGEYARSTAQKRGGGVRTVSLDVELAERQLGDASDSAPESFDREWALGVMERSLERLEGEFKQGVRRGPFEALVKYFRAAEPLSYAQAADEHGMSISQFKAFLHRTRKRFRALVREEVSHTLNDGDDPDHEISALIQALKP